MSTDVSTAEVWMTTKQAAEAAGFSDSHLRRLAAAASEGNYARMIVRREGRRWFIRSDTLPSHLPAGAHQRIGRCFADHPGLILRARIDVPGFEGTRGVSLLRKFCPEHLHSQSYFIVPVPRGTRLIQSSKETWEAFARVFVPPGRCGELGLDRASAA